MRPNESFIAQPIRSLQTMLRVIGESDPLLPSVIPDGIYGHQTVTAVSAFQRRLGLPITGITDQQTWDTIYAVYQPALIQIGPAQVIESSLEPNQVIRRGEQHPDLYLTQGMLMVLSGQYTAITPPSMNGILDIPTSQSLESFQALQNLPVTGELDRITWHNLALQYPLASRLTLEQKGRNP